MLTGEPPHTGATVQAIIARVLTDKPRSVRATREHGAGERRRRACSARWQSCPRIDSRLRSEFAEALQDSRFSMPVSVIATGTTTTASTPRAAGAPMLVKRAATFVPWVIAAAAIAVAGWSLTKDEPTADSAVPARFDLTLPETMVFRGGPGDLAISPDGRRLAMLVTQGGQRKIALRSLSDTELRLLDGTDASRLFFSPDGTSLGFVVNNWCASCRWKAAARRRWSPTWRAWPRGEIPALSS